MSDTVEYYARKLYWSLVVPLRTVYRFIVRPHGRGIKVVVKNQETILLVRPNYGHRLWTVPGGGVEKQEDFEEAAHRELEEEIGVRLHSLEEIGEYVSTQNYRTDTIRCFIATLEDTTIKLDKVEVSEVGWFSPNTLPFDRTPRVDKIIKMAGLI